MASTKAAKRPPKTVAGFTILPLTLPSLPGLPAQATSEARHYLYIKPHEPSQPEPDADRSLFLSNVPFDANEANLRTLFAEQFGGLRVERVEFDSSVPATPSWKRYKSAPVAAATPAAGRGRKRKRDEEIVAEGVVEDEESALPRVWKGELRRSGGCAVVVFVDKASARGTWKEVRAAVKEGREIRWVGGEVVLGVQRKSPILLITLSCCSRSNISC